MKQFINVLLIMLLVFSSLVLADKADGTGSWPCDFNPLANCANAGALDNTASPFQWACTDDRSMVLETTILGTIWQVNKRCNTNQQCDAPYDCHNVPTSTPGNVQQNSGFTPGTATAASSSKKTYSTDDDAVRQLVNDNWFCQGLDDNYDPICCSESNPLVCIIKPSTAPDGFYGNLMDMFGGELPPLTSTPSSAPAAPSTPATTSSPVPEVISTPSPVAGIDQNCADQASCQAIDEIWMQINDDLTEQDKDLVWVPPLSKWIKFELVYKPSQAVAEEASVAGIPKKDVEKIVDTYNTYKTFIDAAYSTYNIDKSLILAIIYKESSGNPEAGSSAGAKGLMQLMPITIQDINTGASKNKCSNIGIDQTNVNDPEKNIKAGTCYFAYLKERFGSDIDSALAAYNWGPTKIDDNCPNKKFSGCTNVREETKNYVPKVNQYQEIIERNKLLEFEFIKDLNNVKCVAGISSCVLKKPAMDALKQVAASAASQGYHLVITSGFRTVQDQEKIWDQYNGNGVCGRPFIRCPHVSGTAVDLYIQELNLMPRQGAYPYDENIPAHKQLRELMTNNGWSPIQSEWWHFEYRGVSVS